MISATRIPALARMAALTAITRKQTVHVVNVHPDVHTVLAQYHVLSVRMLPPGAQYVSKRVTIVRVAARPMAVPRVAIMAIIGKYNSNKGGYECISCPGRVHRVAL